MTFLPVSTVFTQFTFLPVNTVCHVRNPFLLGINPTRLTVHLDEQFRLDTPARLVLRVGTALRAD